MQQLTIKTVGNVIWTPGLSFGRLKVLFFDAQLKCNKKISVRGVRSLCSLLECGSYKKGEW